jgi:putative Ca2+/H+ antiporter (TMEM165/GDT1 family)
VYKLLTIFFSVFVAELGDKTQVATILFASQRDLHPLWVFFAAAAALVLSTGLAVSAGNVVGKQLDQVPLKLIAGIGFILIGVWNLIEHHNA